MLNRKAVCITGLLFILNFLSGCAVQDRIATKMLEKSGVLESNDYLEYEHYAGQGLLDVNGYYLDDSTDGEKPDADADILITFGDNNNLRISYYSDSLLRNTIDASNCIAHKGDSIYAFVEISEDIFSSMYDFSEFRVYEYTRDGEKRKSSLEMEKISNNVYELKLPENYSANGIYIEPIGGYRNRVISLNDYYIDENDVKQPLSGKWTINEKVYTDDTASISPIADYIISYNYDSSEYFYLSSSPEVFYSSNLDGVVIFNQRDASDDTLDYTVELHKYLTVKLISDMNRYVKVDNKKYPYVQANTEIEINKLKYGDTVEIETDKAWSGLETNRELILTKTEALSNGNYRYTLIVPEKGGEFTFDPADYDYEHGKVRFKCFGQVVTGRQILAKGSRIYYEQESADTGYWLAGKPEENYIVVDDQEKTDQSLREIHFVPKVDVVIDLPQPAYGGDVQYTMDGKRLFGKSCSTYSGAVITMEFFPWEGWISIFAGKQIYRVKDSSQVINVNDLVTIDKVFYEDEAHKPALNVNLEKTVGKDMIFNLEASGYKMGVESYAGGWQVTDIFNKNSKTYDIINNTQKVVQNQKIGTEKPIQISMKNRAIQYGTAVRLIISKTDSNNKVYTETRYIANLSEEIDPINIYEDKNIGHSKIWNKSIDITIGVVDVNALSMPRVSANTHFSVKNVDTNETLSNGYLIEDSQNVVVTITPDEGYYITGKKVIQDVYSDTMKYSDYLKNVSSIISDHPAVKYYVVRLDESDPYAEYTYKLDGKEVSGTINVKDGQSLELTYEITDSSHKLKKADGGFIFGWGASYTKATETIKLSSDYDGKTITRRSFGIETE